MGAIGAALVLLNFLGGIVGGIWLLVIGDWSTFGYGLLYLFAGTFVISLLMLPGLVLTVPMAKLANSGRQSLAFVVGLPSLLWTYAVVTFTCIVIFSWVMGRVEGSPVPYLLWSYAVATGPWSFMASKEERGHSGYANLTVFASQLGLTSLFVAYFTDPTDLSFERLAWWFVPLMVAALISGALMAWANLRTARRYQAYGEF